MDNINYLDQEYMEKLLTNFSKATGLFIEAVDVYGKTFFTPKDIEMCEFCSYIRSNEEAIKKCEQSYRKACQEAFRWKTTYFFRYKGNMVIMKIKGIDSIELAQKLKTKNMYIGRDQGKELEEDEFFVADLIGLDVFTVDGEKVGVVKDVLQHAINDVYVVNNGEKEYLIPSIEKFVPTIDLEENKMIINPIKGMLD